MGENKIFLGSKILEVRAFQALSPARLSVTDDELDDEDDGYWVMCKGLPLDVLSSSLQRKRGRRYTFVRPLYISSSSWRWCLFLFQNQTENMLSFISKSWWICIDKHINSVICRLTGCSASNPNFNNLFWVMTRTTMMTVVQWLWWWSMMTIVNLLH